MALQKIKIDGDRLRQAIRENGYNIKGLAHKAGIGEKTLHRILNGELLRRDKVESVFEVMGLQIEVFESAGSLIEQEWAKMQDEVYFGGNRKVTLSAFEIPDYRYLPYILDWKLDVKSPTEDHLEILERFNESVSGHLNTRFVHSNEFKTEYQKLAMGTEIRASIDKMNKLGMYVFCNAYTRWVYHDVEQYDENGDRVGVIRRYNDQRRLAILVTNKIRSGTIPATVDKGEWPISLKYNDSNKFLATEINGKILPELPLGEKIEDHSVEFPSLDHFIADGKF